MKEIVKIHKWVAVVMYAIVCMTVTGCSNDPEPPNAKGVFLEGNTPVYLWINEHQVLYFGEKNEDPHLDSVGNGQNYVRATIDNLYQIIREDTRITDEAEIRELAEEDYFYSLYLSKIR